MISGAVYTVFGMKQQWVHCFFSFAFLVAIAITALELLLVPTPVTDGQQGGYIAGVIVGGAAAGGLATLRPKFFHFFGSVLGGCCLAMWLLTLKESALLGQDTLKNSIFLAAFSLVSLGFYCNTRTKHYLVMFSSSFSGATAFILGIDCVSCAGLKEFWAWIWNLPNDGLFPIDADTYPLKTGMKAELGVMIVLFLLGVVFQWAQLKTIKEQRIKKKQQRNEALAAVHKTDEKAGLDFERRIAAERSEFEATYSGPKRAVYTGRGPRAENVLSPIKKLWKSFEGKRTTKEEAPRQEQCVPHEMHGNDQDNVETRVSTQTSGWDEEHATPKDQARASVYTAHDSGVGDADTERKQRISGSATTVTRVSTVDNEPEIELDDIRPVQPKTAAEAVMTKDENSGGVTIHVAVDEAEVTTAARAAQNPVPEVIPLPFTVPSIEGAEEERNTDDEDCSSVAVITEGFHDDEWPETRSTLSKRSSFAKRLSTGSADLFRRISHHSLSKHLEKAAMGESTEELAVSQHGDRSSMAATCDDVSSVDEDGLPASESVTQDMPFSMEITAELADHPTSETTECPDKGKGAAAVNIPGQRPVSMAAAGAEEASAQVDESARDASEEEKGKQADKAPSDNDESSKPVETNVPEAASRPLTLATGKLDKKVSEIVKQYRMVEWAKHQTLAEEPILDNLDLPELDGPSEHVPVDVEDLLKTAGDGAPRLAKPRTEALLQARARNVSGQSQVHLSPDPENDPTGSMSGDLERQAAIRGAAAALAGGPVHRDSPTPYEMQSAVPAAGLLRSRPPVPGVKSYNTPQSLVAKRETMLRMKQQAIRPGSNLVYDRGEGYGSVAALSPPSLASGPNSTPSSRRNSASYASANMSSALQDIPDDDDMPLSHRQAIIRERRSSMNSGNSSANQTRSDGSSRRSISGLPPSVYGSSSSLAVNQNLPHIQRRSFNTSQNRVSQLADFRSSVQADLRASNTSLPVTSMLQQPGFGGGYASYSMAPVNGPLIDSVTSSANPLPPQQTQLWNADLSRNLDIQRQSMMAQKATDARRREQRRVERERQSQLRQSSMGTHKLLEAHSAALINLQKKARDAI